MKKSIWMYVSLMIVGLIAWPAIPSRAQESAKSAAAAAQELADAAKPVYHLVFVVREMDGSKVVNSRTYSMSVLDHDRGKIRAGSNVPVQIAENNFQYQNVGINIDCSVQGRDNSVLLNAKFEMPGFAPPPPPPPDGTARKYPRPVFRDFSLEEQPEVPLGKPTIIGNLDDLSTSHHFEFEVTVTKVM